MDKFTFRKYISTSELFFSLILILRLFFFIAVVSGNFWAIWSGMLVVCVWRVNVRREPETGSFLIAVPIVIATVDVWLRTRVVFIVYLSIVLTYINSYRIVVSYWFDCFFFCTCYRILSSNLIALTGRGGGTRAIQLGGDARGAWRPSISNSPVAECRSHPHFSASQSFVPGGCVPQHNCKFFFCLPNLTI